MNRLDNKTVLVLEDDPILALDLALRLEDLGAIVAGPAHNVATALAMLARHPIDGALLDINLRGETSYPVAARLISLDIPFLFVSGIASAEIPNDYRRYLHQKPADIATLARALFPDDE